MISVRPHLVAIGGVGGSGTRVGAALLRELGYYTGDDLNESLDNLWFTLLFKRRAVLTESRPEFENLLTLFWSRMSGAAPFSGEARARLLDLAREARPQHSLEWLGQRAESMSAGTTGRRDGQAWGWKEPNTHIVIERILESRPELRYIHFTRHPLDMAFSDNQMQLETWGPILLDRDARMRPRASLAYWCTAHRRISGVMRRYSERTLTVDFDAFCAAPERHCARIAEFLEAPVADEVRAGFGTIVNRDRPIRGRFRKADLAQFDPEDLAYVRDLGYAVE
jgi:hypothetical protein